MKILFTGASSFTGLHFATALQHAGHRVICALMRPKDSYTGLRKKRIELLEESCECIFGVPFGSEAFLQILKENEPWDLLCHHAAEVTDYKNPQFDYAKALSNNTHNLSQILENSPFKGIVLTGSVFEQNEGKGSDALRAVSPYGLSKGLTSAAFRYFCQTHDIPLAKFVIPNPIGPFEEPRFTSYLVEAWKAGEVPEVKTPEYVRDNIPVTLLADVYCSFVQEFYQSLPAYAQLNPSFYAESQGEFTKRFSSEMKTRLNLSCEFKLCKQTAFPEPKERINLQLIDVSTTQWNETRFWDEYSDYFKMN